MHGGNPNQSNPYAIQRHDRSPMQVGYTNPYGFGRQRVMGQLAVQPRARAGLDLNWFSRYQPMQTQQRRTPMQVGYTMRPMRRMM